MSIQISSCHGQSIPRRCRLSVLLFLFFGLVASSPVADRVAWAGSLISVELQTDGSIDPPGDMLWANVRFGPNDDRLQLVINVFLVDSESREVRDRIRGARPEFSDAEGRLVLTKDVNRETPRGPLGIGVHVPYSAFRLSNGEHLIGYVVALKRGNEVLAERASRLTWIRVSNEPRRQMEVVEAVQVPVEFEEERSVLILEGGELVARKTTVRDTRLLSESRTRTVALNIPGGFERTEYPITIPVAWAPAESGLDADAINLSRRTWVPEKQRRIFFATNRNVRAGQNSPAERFGSDVSGSMSYGTAVVSIPVEEHRRGELETPSWWQRRDPKRFFLLELVTLTSRDNFRNVVCNPLADTKNDVLLFIHGYNTTFEFACLRMGQLSHDLEFAGSPVIFSWPSQGRVQGYGDDETAASQSGQPLSSLLFDLNETLRQLEAPGRIHIIAHSMGNRVLLSALSLLSNRIAADQSRIGHVILAAPDVDLRPFVANFPAAERLSASVSLYFCQSDLALTGSQYAHVNSRLGQEAVFMPGLANIDATRVDTSLLGHGYFASRSELLMDIDEVFAGLKPDDRRTIRRATFTSPDIPVGNVYWMFP